MSNFIILPTQLFDKKYLDKSYNYIIWEHPHYFLTYKYNKKKIYYIVHLVLIIMIILKKIILMLLII